MIRNLAISDKRRSLYFSNICGKTSLQLVMKTLLLDASKSPLDKYQGLLVQSQEF